MREAYQLLPFESEIFGQPVWRLMDSAQALDIVVKAKAANVALISYRENHGEQNQAALEKAGFYPVEVLTTLEKPLTDHVEFPDNAAYGISDMAMEVASVARCCFQFDRYHADENISDEIADEIKSRWMFNATTGRADQVFIYHRNGKIIGFNACLLKDRIAIIDLIGVAPECQGQGVGKALVQAMASHYFGQADMLRLGTQLTNEKSQRFYEDLGFKEVVRQQTWHWTGT